MASDDDFMKAARLVATQCIVPPHHASQLAPFATIEVSELAALWRRIQRLWLHDRTDETFSAEQYFELLPHEDPRRALALALEVLRLETDRSVRMQLNDRMMTALIHRHADALIDEIEAVAKDNAGFRWLLGGIYEWASGETRARLAVIADISGWGADQEAADRPEDVIDYRSLSVDGLAKAWIEQKSKPSKDYDNWHELCEYENELEAHDPEKIIDLAIAVLRIESNPSVLGLLAAGPLENVVGYVTIDRIEREAAADERFTRLLGGVWCFSEPDDIKARLEAILHPICEKN